MTFPFEALSESARQPGLVVAVLIGVAFGFVLERAGFGRADKLAAQFYFRDLTVFKVMFTAIVTAMLGLVAAAHLGLADLRGMSESIASWTWIWPMLVGGLVLGVGFILSGYCPGTSLVSAASGNVDGMMTVAGVVAGTLAYTQLLRIDAVQRFHESGAKEAWFLYDLLPLQPWAIAAVVAVMAVLAFIGAELVEKREGRTWRYVIPAFACLMIVAGAGLATRASSTQAAAAPPTSNVRPPLRVIEEPWRYRIEGKRAIDTITGVAYAYEAPVIAGAAPRSQAPRPDGTFTKPKKKGGGCSS